jgi:hypothetical protein
MQWNLYNLTLEFSDILWHLIKIYGPKVFLLIKIKPEYFVNFSSSYFFIIPSPTKLRRDIVTLPSVLPSVRPSHPCEHSRININYKNWMHSFEVSLGYESVDRTTFSTWSVALHWKCTSVNLLCPNETSKECIQFLNESQ